MIADILALFSIFLMVARYFAYDSVGNKWVIGDILAATIMFFAIYFWIFTPTGITHTTGTIVASNVTQVINETSTSSAPAVPLNSFEFEMLMTFGLLVLLVNILFAVKDFLDANKYKKGQGLQVSDK